MFRKVLTVLIRAIVIFFGFPLFLHLHKTVILDLIRNRSPLRSIILIASVLVPMALDSLIDQDSEQTQLLTNERGQRK